MLANTSLLTWPFARSSIFVSLGFQGMMLTVQELRQIRAASEDGLSMFTLQESASINAKQNIAMLKSGWTSKLKDLTDLIILCEFFEV